MAEIASVLATPGSPSPGSPSPGSPSPGSPSPESPSPESPAPGPSAEIAPQVAAVLAATPITFDPDSAALEGAPAEAVAQVAALLLTTDGPVTVEGHVADTPGSPDVAQQLSERRAAVVTDALVAAGVPPERITAVGRGAAEPLTTRAASRRVDVEID